MSFIETVLFYIFAPLIIIGCVLLIICILYCTCKKIASDSKERRAAENAYSSQGGTEIRDIITQSQQQSSVGMRRFSPMLSLSIMMCLVCIACTQTTTQTLSYRSCSDASSPTHITCANDGLYTYVNFTYTRPSDSTTLFHTTSTWRVVAANITGVNELDSLNVCSNMATCTKIADDVEVSIRSLGIKSAQKLVPTDFISPYGYFFTTFNDSESHRIIFPSHFDDGLTACTGFPTQLNTRYTNPQRPASGLDFRAAAALNTDMCGTTPDLDMVGNSSVFFHANRFGAAHAGMCTPCPASGIATCTAAMTLPFGRCNIMAMAANPNTMVEIDVNITSSAYTDPERLLLSSLDGNSGMKRSSRNFARGMLTSLSYSNANANLVSGLSTAGYIALCGDPTEGSARPVSKTEDHLLTGVGAVPTANFFGHNFMWYYISPGEFNSAYGTACGKIGGLGGIDQELYGSTTRMATACANTVVGKNALDGPCIPGVSTWGTPTPCQVASELNEFSAAWVAWRDGGSVGPAPTLPPHLPPNYNPDSPNIHLTRRRDTFFLTYTDTPTDSVSDIEYTLRLDVSEDFVQYADEQSNAVIDNTNTTQCQYSLNDNTGALLVQICNRGEKTQSFQVKLVGCEDEISMFDFQDGSLPLVKNITNLSSTIHDNCMAITPWLFTLEDATAVTSRVNSTILTEKLALPAVIGKCEIQILNEDGTVVVGRTSASEILDCIAFSVDTQFINQTILYQDNNNYGFWCMITFQCPEAALMFYFVLASVIGVIVAIIVAVACCASKDKKDDDAVRKTNGDYASVEKNSDVQ